MKDKKFKKFEEYQSNSSSCVNIEISKEPIGFYYCYYAKQNYIKSSIPTTEEVKTDFPDLTDTELQEYSLKSLIRYYFTNSKARLTIIYKFGRIEDWDVSRHTNFDNLFEDII